LSLSFYTPQRCIGNAPVYASGTYEPPIRSNPHEQSEYTKNLDAGNEKIKILSGKTMLKRFGSFSDASTCSTSCASDNQKSAPELSNRSR